MLACQILTSTRVLIYVIHKMADRSITMWAQFGLWQLIEDQNGGCEAWHDSASQPHHAMLLGKNSYCGLSCWFEVRSLDHCSWSADPVNRTGTVQHLTQFIIHKGTLVLVGCRLELQSHPESDTHHQGVWVNILSEDQHYLLIWLFVPEPQIQYNMSPTMSSESKLPGKCIKLHVLNIYWKNRSGR